MVAATTMQAAATVIVAVMAVTATAVAAAAAAGAIPISRKANKKTEAYTKCRHAPHYPLLLSFQ